MIIYYKKNLNIPNFFLEFSAIFLSVVFIILKGHIDKLITVPVIIRVGDGKFRQWLAVAIFMCLLSRSEVSYLTLIYTSLLQDKQSTK